MAKGNTLTTRVAVVEEQVDRFESAIEKLVEVSQSLKEIIAVQSQQIQENKDSNLFLREQMSRETNLLHKKIKDLDNEVSRELESQYKEIMSVLKEMRQEQKDHHLAMSSSVDTITKEIKEETEREIKELSDQIRTLQKWRWIVIGGAGAVGYIASIVIDIMKIQ